MKRCLVFSPHARVILLPLKSKHLLYFCLETGVMLEKMTQPLMEGVIHLAHKGVLFDLLIKASTLEGKGYKMKIPFQLQG